MKDIPLMQILRRHQPSEAVDRELDYRPAKPFDPGIDVMNMPAESVGDYALLFVVITCALAFIGVYFDMVVLPV
jgi:hypothetical protein